MAALAAFARRLGGLPQPGTVSLTVADGVARLTLRNARSRNSLTGPMMAQFADAVHSLEASDAWAVVLAGDGGHFCAGADLNLALEHLTTGDDARLMSELMTSTLGRLRALPILSIAAIDGNAVGGGAELATATDWRVFAADAHLQFVQTRMGASTGWGGSARLAEIVGRRATALKLLLHQPRLDAHAAMDVGLADAVAPAGESATDAAERLLLSARERAASPGAIRAVKAAVASATPVDDAAVAAETSAFATTWGAPPNRHALAAAAAAIARKRGGADTAKS
jgi:ethylmalonyl-CoA/methylmalonyl-CoA decarboxylase